MADLTAPPASPSPSVPALDPGPVVLTVEEAGNRYLDLVCERNLAANTVYQAFVAGEP